jgi:hypothetical protein
VNWWVKRWRNTSFVRKEIDEDWREVSRRGDDAGGGVVKAGVGVLDICATRARETG